ncbi:uncharacterized protein LOC131145791 [Malania oleifera]|uniref:uncharacterized protein LOC131145791 n=1 Tax=Malania oleifera TaxID=397392 RepID=UPI0025AE2663|nr:uncharacterized protein LOC131145791 [Malania oleifera]
MARRALWHSIYQLSKLPSPWLLLGDFNYVLSAAEKENGRPISDYDTRDMGECFFNSSLSDLRSSECFLTWTNGTIWSKLDRVIANQRWILEGRSAKVEFLFPGILSDHSVCLISLFEEGCLGRRSFKFFNLWTLNHNSLAIIKQARAEKAGKEVIEIQQKLHNNPLDGDLQLLLNEKKYEAVRLAEANRMSISQIAKSRYLKESDKGTTFFHSLMRSRRNRNYISTVTKLNRDQTRSQAQEEIKMALFSIRDSKSPAPDGFSMLLQKILEHSGE